MTRAPGRPATVTGEQVEDVTMATLESTPKNAAHWSRAKMAQRSGLSKSTIGRIWKAFELKPHRAEGERFFAYITSDLLQRSDHRNVQALEADIRNWIKKWNTNPKPLHLDQDRRPDPRIHRTTTQTN